MIELVLPYPISANRYWRTFMPRGFKAPVTTLSKEAKDYKREVKRLVEAAGVLEPLPGRVRVEIELYPFRPQDYAKRARANPMNWDDDVRCIDLDNATKVLFDSLKGAAFGDDKFVFEYSAKRCEPDGEGRLVVRIAEIHVDPMVGELALIPRQPLKSALAEKPF